MKKFTDSPNVRKAAWILLIVGGINRGLIGLFSFDLVTWIFGNGFFAHVIYTIIGIATVYVVLYPEQKRTPLRR